MSSTGSDQDISSTKVEPLASNLKGNQAVSENEGGFVGTDENVGKARIDPVGGEGQNQEPATHTDTQGVIGHDNTVAGAKIEPLASDTVSDENQKHTEGLEDEVVDASRVEPQSGVPEQTPK